MPRCEDLSSADLLVEYDDNGEISSIRERGGKTLGFVLSKKDVTGGLRILSGTDNAMAAMGIGRAPGRVFALLGDSRTKKNLQSLGAPTSVVRASGVVTVVKSAHGLKTGQKILVENLKDATATYDFALWSAAAVTRVDANTFTYPDARTDATASWGQITLPVSGAVAVSGIYILNWFDAGSYWQNLNGFFGGGLRLATDFCYGWGGAFIEDMATLVKSVAASGATDVIFDGGSNNIVAGTYTSAQIAALGQSVVEALRKYGLKVWWKTIYPVGSGYASPLTKNAQVIEVNRLTKAYVAAHPDVVLLDSYAAIVDPMNASAGAGLAGAYIDNIHPSSLGARLDARKMYATMSPLIAVPDPKITSNAENYAANSASLNILNAILMTAATGGATTGSTGTVTGLTVATGLTMVVTGATAACTGGVSARSDGYGYNQTFAFTAGAGGDQLKISIAVPTPTTRTALNDLLTAYAEIALYGVSGSGLKGVFADLVMSDGSTTGHSYSSNSNNSAALYGADDSTQTATIYKSLVWGNAQISLDIYITFAAAGTALSGKIGRVSVLKNEP